MAVLLLLVIHYLRTSAHSPCKGSQHVYLVGIILLYVSQLCPFSIEEFIAVILSQYHSMCKGEKTYQISPKVSRFKKKKILGLL